MDQKPAAKVEATEPHPVVLITGTHCDSASLAECLESLGSGRIEVIGIIEDNELSRLHRRLHALEDQVRELLAENAGSIPTDVTDSASFSPPTLTARLLNLLTLKLVKLIDDCTPEGRTKKEKLAKLQYSLRVWLREYNLARCAVPMIVQLLRIHWREIGSSYLLYEVYKLLKLVAMMVFLVCILASAGAMSTTTGVARCIRQHFEELRRKRARATTSFALRLVSSAA